MLLLDRAMKLEDVVIGWQPALDEHAEKYFFFLEYHPEKYLALRAMSRTTELERARLFALGRPLTPDPILAWAAEEAVSTSRIQRRRWRLFRVEV